MTENLKYIPWTWTVQPSNPDVHCPPASSILATFGIVNVLVSLAGVIFGNRFVVNYITFGVFGKPNSVGWSYMWIVTVELHLASNALVACIIKKTAGYGNDFAIADLMLFFLLRPRLSWVFLLGFSIYSRWTDEKEKQEQTPVGSPENHAFKRFSQSKSEETPTRQADIDIHDWEISARRAAQGLSMSADCYVWSRE